MNNRRVVFVAAVAALAGLAAPLRAQWNPAAGQWGKSDPNDFRFMTYNVLDDICSCNTKQEGNFDWCALARIVAALKPDVLIMQECADNNSECGTGTADSVSSLQAAIGYFLHGGNDQFHGNVAVTSYVQKYAPGYDLPYVYVSSLTDGFNRNVILSRYPFGDVNGDGVSRYSDFSMAADQYAPGGNGGIRGFMTTEIILDHAVYAGNLVVGNSHLKSGTAQSDYDDRLSAAKNISYYINYQLNGAGTGNPDPNNKINLVPNPTIILPSSTPFICGGDYNEWIQTSPGNRYGPAQWVAWGPTQGGTDGNDRNQSDSTYDDSLDQFTGSRVTQSSGNKDDYIIWQDSIATLRRSFIFYTPTMPAGAIPPEITGFPGGASNASNMASDHRPVVADFILPLAGPTNPPGAFSLSAPANNAGAQPLTPTLSWAPSNNAAGYTVSITPPGGPTSTFDTAVTSMPVPDGLLAQCQTVSWGVTATNSGGTVASTPASRNFTTTKPADFNHDGLVTVQDVFDFLTAWFARGPDGDFNGDMAVTPQDIFDFLTHWFAGC